MSPDPAAAQRARDETSGVLLLETGLVIDDDDLIECGMAILEAVQAARGAAGEVCFVPFEFDIDALSEHEVYHHFRFYKPDLYRLHTALGLEGVVLRRDTHVYDDSFFALLVYLRRMAYPSRLNDMPAFMGQPFRRLCDINMAMYDHMSQFNHLVLAVNNHLFLPRFDLYEERVDTKIGFNTHTVGFLDGTFKHMCRPTDDQEAVYSGYKRGHGFNYQGLVFPDGMLGLLHGPHSGRLHDATTFFDAGLDVWLERHMPEDKRIYADKAYPLLPGLGKAIRRAHLTPDEESWNASMNCARTCIEWSFGMINSKWAYGTYAVQLKAGLSPIGGRFLQSGVLANCINCLYQSAQTSWFYDCQPPTLEEYLNAPPNDPD